ncbi:ATP-binding protein [Sediminitomix flava]|uniref:histidine kinase n=1 Tax=Sediminitomix flava TaxID=379075 RepID=A0A315ZGQ0_SEDFL|nr:ATP-binding protein [Sediminitomix flava]PWJ44522.1 signal transduction histidine kinase [Sediminitomix flava]
MPVISVFFISLIIIYFYIIFDEYRSFNTDLQALQQHTVAQQATKFQESFQDISDDIYETAISHDKTFHQKTASKAKEIAHLLDFIYSQQKFSKSQFISKLPEITSIIPIYSGELNFCIIDKNGNVIYDPYSSLQSVPNENKQFPSLAAKYYLKHKKDKSSLILGDHIDSDRTLCGLYIKPLENIDWFVCTGGLRPVIIKKFYNDLLLDIEKNVSSKDTHLSIFDQDGRAIFLDNRRTIELKGKHIIEKLELVDSLIHSEKELKVSIIQDIQGSHEHLTIAGNIKVLGLKILLEKDLNPLSARAELLHVHRRQETQNSIIAFTLLLLVLMLIIAWVVVRSSRRVLGNINNFSKFFEEEEIKAIDKEKLHFIEFKSLADKANQMIENHKEANKKIIKQRESIRYQNKVLSQQNQEYQKINLEMNNILSVVAHDLKSPLNSVYGLANLMSNAPDIPKEYKEYAELIQHLISDGNNLIQDLIEVHSRAQQNDSLNIETINVGKLSDGLVKKHEHDALRKKIAINVQAEEDTEITSSLRIINRILDNILNNAIKFSHYGSQIWLHFWMHDDFLKISIKDQGPGIKKNEQHLLFKKYSRLSARPTGGESSSGLGLAIVKQLLEKISGEISFNSEESKGTEFIISIPSMK